MDIAPYVNTALSNTPLLAVKGYGTVQSILVTNPNAAVAYIQFFDAAAVSSVTLGTTTPLAFFPIPLSNGPGSRPDIGIKFTNGLVVAATTTGNGSTAPSTAIPVTIVFA